MLTPVAGHLTRPIAGRQQSIPFPLHQEQLSMALEQLF